jgi:hypothetical protein
MYENGRMRPVENILRVGKGEKGRMMEWVNLTKIHCKHFCICDNVAPVQQ